MSARRRLVGQSKDTGMEGELRCRRSGPNTGSTKRASSGRRVTKSVGVENHSLSEHLGVTDELESTGGDQKRIILVKFWLIPIAGAVQGGEESDC